MLDNDALNQMWQQAVDDFNRGDKISALAKFHDLADNGCEFAYAEIGNIYELGSKDIPVDIESAKIWYKKALIKVGDEEAALALARIAYLGIDGETDFEQAYELYTHPALNDNAVAALRLGVMYQLGEYVDEDSQAALQYYSRAEELGNVVATSYKSTLLYDKKDYVSAVVCRMQEYLRVIMVMLGLKKSEDLRKW